MILARTEPEGVTRPLPGDWQSRARDIHRAAVLAAEGTRLAADRSRAGRVVAALADCDPPIRAHPLGPMAEADGVLFDLNKYGDDEADPCLVMLRRCDQCGELVESAPLGGWGDIGACLDLPPSCGQRPWSYHVCPPRDPADLVSTVRHVLLFAYGPDGEPRLPISVIRRAEESLAAFEGKGSRVDTYA